MKKSPVFKLDNKRFLIQHKNGIAYLLDSHTHQGIELNEASEIICKGLLHEKTVEQISYELIKVFSNLTILKACKEITTFINLLKKHSLFSKDKESINKNIPKLNNVTFSITNKCNLSCKHCLGGNTLKKAKSELSLDKINKLAHEISELGCKNISLFGGEPLLRKDFNKILEIFSTLGFYIKVNTNATLITKEIISDLIRYKVKLVTASLDGSSPEIQEPMRGKDSFNSAVSGIKMLVKSDIPVIISTTVTKYNYNNLTHIAKLAKKLGVKGIRFNDVHFGGHALCFLKDILISNKMRLKVLDDAEKLYKRYGEFISGSFPDLQKKIKSETSTDSLNFPLLIPPCGAAMGSLCIRSDGYVTPCEILWDEKVGNVHKSSLEKIYYESKKINTFRFPKIITAKDISHCNGCRYIKVCFLGHRCAPYFYPGKTLKEKSLLTCLDNNVA
ncbi:MAG: radical SAM protein [uncultured bacterium]|nr:MAG: radical SAM protein [uncultured bacterium]